MELRSQIWATTIESITATGRVTQQDICNQTGADEGEVLSVLDEMTKRGWLREAIAGQYLPGRLAHTSLNTSTKLAPSSD